MRGKEFVPSTEFEKVFVLDRAGIGCHREEEEEEGVFKANAMNEEVPERDRATPRRK